MICFIAEGPEGLKRRKAFGKHLSRMMLGAALAKHAEAGSIPAAHGVVRWRLFDLAQRGSNEFDLSISEKPLSRKLRAIASRRCAHATMGKGPKA